MAEEKRRTNRHLRSARQWLSKAEEAFDKDHDVRAELDILLAQAELQHAREVNRTGRWRFKYPLLQHGLAFGLAVAVAAVGIGGAFLIAHDRDKFVPVPLAAPQTGQSAPGVTLKADIQTQQPVRTEETRPAPAVITADASAAPPVNIPGVPPKENEVKARSAEKQISSDEMQKLIRAAGKSLRGE